MAFTRDLVRGGLFTNLARAILGGESKTTGITAFAGGGQASAVVLTNAINIIATCATGGDSVMLPVAEQGDEVTIDNQGAASCNVFPQVGGAIRGAAANAALALANAKTGFYKSLGSGNWIAVISA